MKTGYYHSPIGVLELKATESALVELIISSKESVTNSASNSIIQDAIEQLTEYFAGKRKTFSIPLAPSGTPFQQQVWTQLQNIPYGKTISYAQLAQMVDSPKACRAVGSANGKNPIPVIIPCHRVITSNGGLGGFAYGLDMKKWLLELEQ